MSKQTPDSNQKPTPQLSASKDAAGERRAPTDAYRMAALDGDYEGDPQYEADARVEPKPYDSSEGRWVEAKVWVPEEAAQRAAERMDEPGSPGRPAGERPTCGLCKHTIRFSGQEESSPFGTVHAGCAKRHRKQHPDQW